MFRENFGDMQWGRPGEALWRPPTDVYETDNDIVVLVEIAGLTPQDYEITLRGRTLIVSGERRSPAGKLAYQQMEIRHGKFRALVQLPWALEGSGQTATYESGFLKITLPKAQVRKVPIRNAVSTDKE